MRRTPRNSGRVLAVSALMVTCAGAVAAPARAPDLVARGVSAPQDGVAPGESLRARITIRNLGSARGRRSRTGLFVSRDSRRGPGDILLGRPRTPALAARARVRLAVGVAVPAATKTGTYHLLACADVTHRVSELSNRNNCASSRATVSIAPRNGGGGDSGDSRPPVFAGLQSATTCLPGPIGPPRSSSYQLSWSPAIDDSTPQKELVYDIYQATTAGGQDFTNAAYTTAPGATTFSTPQLSSAETWHFVVRARDRAGNRDPNTAERTGENLCL